MDVQKRIRQLMAERGWTERRTHPSPDKRHKVSTLIRQESTCFSAIEPIVNIALVTAIFSVVISICFKLFSAGSADICIYSVFMRCGFAFLRVTFNLFFLCLFFA